jgi:hypothetical protein
MRKSGILVVRYKTILNAKVGLIAKSALVVRVWGIKTRVELEDEM